MRRQTRILEYAQNVVDEISVPDLRGGTLTAISRGSSPALSHAFASAAASRRIRSPMSQISCELSATE